jgi:hypothetical protein
MDSKNTEFGEDSNSPVPNLLQVQGACLTTAHV